jgi:hypothetical protein
LADFCLEFCAIRHIELVLHTRHGVDFAHGQSKHVDELVQELVYLLALVCTEVLANSDSPLDFSHAARISWIGLACKECAVCATGRLWLFGAGVITRIACGIVEVPNLSPVLCWFTKVGHSIAELG